MLPRCCCAVEEEVGEQIADVSVTSEQPARQDESRREHPALELLRRDEFSEHSGSTGRPLLFDQRGAANKAAASTMTPAESEESWRGFEAVLKRRHVEDDCIEHLGMQVDLMDGNKMYICDISPQSDSPLARYNRSVPMERWICVGQYITQINGLPGDGKELSAEKVAEVLKRQLLRSESLELSIRLPHLFECEIRKEGASLGLELAHSSHATSLNVTRISPYGAVARCAADVKVGDRIVGVDEVRGRVEDLTQAMFASDCVVLHMSRLS